MSYLVSFLERALPGPLGQRVAALLRHEGAAGTAVKGSIAALMLAVIGVVISFAVQASLTRTLGAAQYGTYTVALGWMNIVLLLTKVELDIATTRFVGAYAATADWGRLHGLLRIVPQRVFLRTAAVAALAVLVLLGMRGSRFGYAVPAGLATTVLLVLTAQLQLRGAALQGFKRVLPAQIPNVVVRPLLFLGIVSATVAAGFALGPARAIVYNGAATLVAILLAARLLRRAVPAEARDVEPISEWREWLRAGYGLFFISAAQLTVTDATGVVLVSLLLGRTSSALYSIANQLAVLVAFASTAVMFIAAPLIAEFYAKRQLDTLRRFARATTTVCLAVSLLLLLGVATFGRPVLGFFGADFTHAYPTLLTLAGSQFVTGSVGALAGWLMTMTGHEREAAWMIGAAGLLQIGLAIPLTAAFGTVGTATATLVAVVARSIMLSLFLRRRLGLLVLPAIRESWRA